MLNYADVQTQSSPKVIRRHVLKPREAERVILALFGLPWRALASKEAPAGKRGDIFEGWPWNPRRAILTYAGLLRRPQCATQDRPPSGRTALAVKEAFEAKHSRHSK